MLLVTETRVFWKRSQHCIFFNRVYFLEPCGLRKTEIFENDDVKCRGQAKTIWKRQLWTRIYSKTEKKNPLVFKIIRIRVDKQKQFKNAMCGRGFFRKREKMTSVFKNIRIRVEEALVFAATSHWRANKSINAKTECVAHGGWYILKWKLVL